MDWRECGVTGDTISKERMWPNIRHLQEVRKGCGLRHLQ